MLMSCLPSAQVLGRKGGVYADFVTLILKHSAVFRIALEAGNGESFQVRWKRRRMYFLLKIAQSSLKT